MPICVPDDRCAVCWKKTAEFIVETGTGRLHREINVCAEKRCLRFAVYGAEVFGSGGPVVISARYGVNVGDSFDAETPE